MKKLLSLFLILFLITSPVFSGTLEIDWMEGLTSDANAQAAYVTNATVTNILSNPSFETGDPPDGWALTTNGGSHAREATIIHSGSGTYSDKVISGSSYAYEQQNAYTAAGGDASRGKTYTFGAWVYCATASAARVRLYDGVGLTYSSYHTGNSTWQYLTVTRTSDASATVLYASLIIDGNTITAYIDDGTLVEGTSTTPSLQSYSESTTKTQGSYALKAVATTGALNKTLTKTFAVNSNLTGVKNLWFDARAGRTGSNIKLGLHDTGGTTTEITPNIITADTYQKVNWDWSAVSDANKDVIDTLTITVTNADAANTFYYDYAEIAQAIDVFGWIN